MSYFSGADKQIQARALSQLILDFYEENVLAKLIVLVPLFFAASVLACSSPIDVEKAHCQQEDLPNYTLVASDLWEVEDWGALEAFSTKWSVPESEIRCLTLIYDNTEDARWSLNYSTALQRAWLQEGVLAHRQIAAPSIGDDNLAFQIETGRPLGLQQTGNREAVATIVMFRRGSAVVMVSMSCCPAINPVMGRYFRPPAVDKPARIANIIDKRILSD